MTCAHSRRPIGHCRSARGRILDLSYAAALELGSLSDGAFRVKLHVLEEAAGAPAGLSPPAKTAAGAPGTPVTAP